MRLKGFLVLLPIISSLLASFWVLLCFKEHSIEAWKFSRLSVPVLTKEKSLRGKLDIFA